MKPHLIGCAVVAGIILWIFILGMLVPAIVQSLRGAL